MNPPRKSRAPGQPRNRKHVTPPQVVVGGGGAGFGDGEPVHVASLLVAEIKQACTLQARARTSRENIETLRRELAALSDGHVAALSRAEHLDGTLDPRMPVDVAALRCEITELERQAIEADTVAESIFARVSGTIAKAIDRAQQFERNLEARAQGRHKTAGRTHAAYVLARDATLAKGWPLTPDNLRNHWPNNGCPENSRLYELIQEFPVSGI